MTFGLRSETWTARRRLLFVMGGAVPFVILALLHWNLEPEPALSDYAQYLLHTMALHEGRPYTDLGIIESPLGRFVGVPYPPGLPLMLQPVVAVFGFSADMLKLVMLISGVAFVVLAGVYFAREHTLLGVGVAVLAGLSTGMVHSSLFVLSDLPFAAAIWLIILLVDRPGPWSAGRVLAVTAMGGAAVALRLAGVALFPAMVVYALVHRKRLGLRPAVPPLIWCIAGILMSLAFFRLRALNVFVPDLSWDKAVLVFNQLPRFRMPVSASLLYPFPWGAANAAYHVVATGLTVVGLFHFFRRARTRIVPLLAVSYVALLLLAPVPLGTRYLWPLFPLLSFGFLLGFEVMWRRLPLHARFGARPAALATALLIAAGAGLSHLGEEPAEPVLAADTRAVFDRVRVLAEDDSVRVVFHKPMLMTWETGVPAMANIRATDQEAERELCERGITHLVLPYGGDGPPEIRERRPLQHYIAGAPHRFTLIARNASFTIHRFDRGGCGLPNRADRAGASRRQ